MPLKQGTDYARWRVISLASVYLLMGLHIAHWKIAGKTLAPLEFNEVLYTLHLGILTAGFIFMGLAMVSTLLFGRFFCSWMCHMLALQDASAWILRKLKIKPRHIRSRTFYWIPVGAVIYLFLLPQLERMFMGQPAVSIHIAGASSNWASFVTTDFWRNLPSIGITLLTFLVCGGFVVYVLGSRTFCQYACPYGMLFSVADRVAPGKILLKGNCTSCGICTSVCDSHIQVHREVKAYGRVIDTNCLKDLDCVQVCPEGALEFGFGQPSGFFTRVASKSGKRKFDFSWQEDAVLLIAAIVFIVIYRGLYDAVPFLLAITLGILLAFGLVISLRVLKRQYVRLGPILLSRPNHRTARGRWFLVLYGGLILFSIHSAIVHWHTWRGEQAYNHLAGESRKNGWEAGKYAGTYQTAVEHLSKAEQWGLYRPASLSRELASLALLRKDTAAAIGYFTSLLQEIPEDLEAGLRFARLLKAKGEIDNAIRILEKVPSGVIETDRDRILASEIAFELGKCYSSTNRFDDARRLFEKSLAYHDGNREAKAVLGVIKMQEGRWREAEAIFRSLPQSPVTDNNLALICLRDGRFAEAETFLERFLRQDPGNVQALYNLAIVRYRQGERAQALQILNDILSRDPVNQNALAARDRILKGGVSLASEK